MPNNIKLILTLARAAGWLTLVPIVSIFCTSCGPVSKVAAIANTPEPAFESISITSTAMNGRIFRGGILVVSHASGTVSVCWKNCQIIGKTEPSGPHDLVLTDGGNMNVYVENIATGRVTACDMESVDNWMSGFKSGKCSDVGIAAR
jgi:hypothetical protein